MTTPPNTAPYFTAAGAGFPFLSGIGLFPPSANALAHPGSGCCCSTVHRGDFCSSLRSRFDVFGYSPVASEGLFRIEEARLDALKSWVKANQDREDVRLQTEAKVQAYVVSRAKLEVEFWEKSVALLDIHRQKAEIELAKAKDKTLDDLIVRKALADAERAEHERDITVTSLKRKAESEADRAVAEVALLECQRQEVGAKKKKVETETKLVEVQVDVAKAQKGKFNAEKGKADAEAAKAVAEKDCAVAKANRSRMKAQTKAAEVQATAAKNAPPSQEEVQGWEVLLGLLKPCPKKFGWEHRPAAGGFRCKAPESTHFMTYAKARACIEAYNAGEEESGSE